MKRYSFLHHDLLSLSFCVHTHAGLICSAGTAHRDAEKSETTLCSLKSSGGKICGGQCQTECVVRICGDVSRRAGGHSDCSGSSSLGHCYWTPFHQQKWCMLRKHLGQNELQAQGLQEEEPSSNWRGNRHLHLHVDLVGLVVNASGVVQKNVTIGDRDFMLLSHVWPPCCSLFFSCLAKSSFGSSYAVYSRLFFTYCHCLLSFLFFNNPSVKVTTCPKH